MQRVDIRFNQGLEVFNNVCCQGAGGVERSNIWASTQENLSFGFANNKGADQPAHPRSLISTFVIHLLESTIYTCYLQNFNFLGSLYCWAG